MKRIVLLGRYDAGMLQNAMRVVLARFHLRQLRREAARRAVISFDSKPDGRAIAL